MSSRRATKDEKKAKQPKNETKTHAVSAGNKVLLARLLAKAEEAQLKAKLCTEMLQEEIARIRVEERVDPELTTMDVSSWAFTNARPVQTPMPDPRANQ